MQTNQPRATPPPSGSYTPEAIFLCLCHPGPETTQPGTAPKAQSPSKIVQIAHP